MAANAKKSDTVWKAKKFDAKKHTVFSTTRFFIGASCGLLRHQTIWKTIAMCHTKSRSLLCD